MTNLFPYIIILPKKNESHLWKMKQWCIDHFGKQWQVVNRNKNEPNGVWAVFWCGRENPTCYRWLFKNDSDATLFSLRWT
jgi:hypothetical protein